jgi:hypothetical protein
MSTVIGPRAEVVSASVRLRDLALASVARVSAVAQHPSPPPEEQLLRQVTSAVQEAGRSLYEMIETCIRRPLVCDAPLVRLAGELRFSPLEVLVVALAAAVEDDPLVGRMLAHVQAPIGGSRPTLGLVAHTFASVGTTVAVVPSLLNGMAVTSGVLSVLNDTAPLSERPIAVPAPLCVALAGHDSHWAGVTIGLDEAMRVALPESVISEARRHADALAAEPGRATVLRTGSPAEGRSVACAIADALRKRPAFVDTDKVAGLGPWVLLRGLLPVFCCELAPGDRRRLPPLPGYSGPVVVVCGPDGSIETAHRPATIWRVPVPCKAARRVLWSSALSMRTDQANELAEQLACEHRHSAGRIAHLGHVARHCAELAGRDAADRRDVLAASWTAEGGGLDALAEALPTLVPDGALVAAPMLRADLEALLLRCRNREDLVEGLGAALRTRYKPGVRALFTGPSGTGKTLAASWVATRLGMPLYRVDLASVTSKYIGETEKNLSQLLARAEQADVILLFDEADSLFGKRTDIRDANDRFANAQTNYLLQRIESYEGIVVLTSNSQARFDQAFARRLDIVIEFPIPGPQERRALWEAHLGADAPMRPDDLNRLALLLDLSGGHIRNVVLAAAAHARGHNRRVGFEDLLAGLETELRNMGRQVPVQIRRPS